MQFPDRLFANPAFGGGFPDDEQGASEGGMDFSDWLNFTPQGGSLE